MYVNVVGVDMDHDSSGLLRLSAHEPWRPWHRAQPYYAPILFALLFSFTAWTQDFSHFRQARREDPGKFGGWAPLAELIGAKLLHVAVVILLPAWALDLSLIESLFGYVAVVCLASFLFIFLLIGTHFAEEAACPEPDAPSAACRMIGRRISC